MRHVRGVLDETRPMTPAELEWWQWYRRDATFYEPEVFCADCGSRPRCCKTPEPRRSFWRRLLRKDDRP